MTNEHPLEDLFERHRSGYNAVAADYVTQIYHELEGKPFDRDILDRFADRLRGRGIVCDMGCGPGHVARYLADRGLHMVGVDLSPGMLAQAAALNPDISFHPGNMLALDEPDETWSGIAAFYSIIHIPPEAVMTALQEMFRVLQPGGLLLMAFHTGGETLHETELWGHAVAFDYWFYDSREMVDYLARAGYRVLESVERDPYSPEVEYQSRRAYILAGKPSR